MEEEIVLIEPPPLDRTELEKLVGTKVKNLQIYQRAFTHKSALKKYLLTESFETLEFIGDSVLGFIVTKLLFDQYESKQEGFLTKARTKLVRGATLATIAERLHLDQWVLMDDKGIRNNWNRNPKILEDVFEALVGAMYLDLGLLHTRQFVLGIYSNPSYVNLDCIMIDDNYKDQLMRYCQTQKYNLPHYDWRVEDGQFHISVFINGAQYGYGFARSKKQAEQYAAYDTLLKVCPGCL